ncbi:hypothetical protein, partial [Sphingomonas bacterium]|uniref:hypothetical protein n=1 Tax=Sphingomonas bacterium TaxID=1895847 RepID=UPI00157506E1
MSYIPAKKMHHAHAEPGEFDAEAGKIIPLKPAAPAKPPRSAAMGWVLGAAGAGIAAVAIGALLSLRASSAKTP